MFKRIICASLVVLFVFLAASCGKTKTVQCDNCKKELEIEESSQMNDEWIIYCEDCEKELGLDTIVE